MSDNPLTEQEFYSIPVMVEHYQSYDIYLKSILIEV
jgi:hypothetical protein